MIKKQIIKKSIILIILCIIPMLVVMFYPVVDWVTEPLLIYLFMLPILLMQVLSLFVLLKLKTTKVVFIVQIILTVIMYLIMGHYLRTH